MLEAAPEDIEIADGKYQVRGSPDKGLTLADISGAAYVPEGIPEGMEPGLEETAFYDPENFVWPFGAHAAIVDVDADTGKVKVVRYVAVDDCGRAINPMLIEGQVHGGITHAIGQALYEQVVYDETGQLVTGTFVDYALPTAAEVPSFETDRTETPSPVNSLGVKGVGRGGHDRRHPHAGQRRGRRAASARRHIHRHAVDADARVERDPSRERRRRCVVIPAEFDYVVADSIEDAIRLLGEGGEDAKLLAGGHSLLPLMKLRLAAPTLLIDLRKVPGLGGAERQNGGWRIGAMSRHSELSARDDLGLVAVAAGSVADQQVRNRGTIGGSLVHGDPASDLPAVVLAFEGSVTAQGPSGEREIAASDLFQDYLTTAVEPAEVVTRINLPALDGYGHGYEKFTRRAEDWAMVGACALVKSNGGTCEDVRVGLTHMGSVPLRATAVEDALRGQPLDAASIAKAAEHAGDNTDPPGDLNATPEYKRHLARVLTRRALSSAAGIDA